MTSINISKNLNANIKTNTDLQGNLNQEHHLVGNITTANGVLGSLSTDNQLTCKLNHTQTLNTSLAIAKGDKGEDGYTPIKGIDYFTEEDINSLKDIFSTIDHTHKNKIDDVVIEGNILKFYADNVLIKEIKLPANIDAESRAVCGEFLCGELLVGEGLSVKARNEVFKWVDGVTPVNAENMNRIEDRIEDNKLTISEHIENHPFNIHLGENPPNDIEIGAWVDTSDIEEITQDISDSILDEFRSIFNSMQEQILSLKTKTSELEARIYWLEMNSGGSSSPVGGDILVLEDNTILTLEDGTILTFE